MGGTASRHTLTALLGGLQDALLALFLQRQQAEGRRRRALQKRLLFGLELLWKIEGQVVLPALLEARPERAAELDALLQELELMRDLALLSQQTASGNRDLAMSILQGGATLHFTRLQGLLSGRSANGAVGAVGAVGQGEAMCDAAAPPVAAVDWRALQAEVQALLGRWRGELVADGRIEDEEADPVGAAPR